MPDGGVGTGQGQAEGEGGVQKQWVKHLMHMVGNSIGLSLAYMMQRTAVTFGGCMMGSEYLLTSFEELADPVLNHLKLPTLKRTSQQYSTDIITTTVRSVLLILPFYYLVGVSVFCIVQRDSLHHLYSMIDLQYYSSCMRALTPHWVL